MTAIKVLTAFYKIKIQNTALKILDKFSSNMNSTASMQHYWFSDQACLKTFFFV